MPKTETEHLSYAPVEYIAKALAKCGSGKCWNCKYFRENDAMAATASGKGSGLSIYPVLEGACHFNAPQPGSYPMAMHARWPMVDGLRDWCGKFEVDNREPSDFVETIDPAMVSPEYAEWCKKN
jgi:hypothetical protein